MCAPLRESVELFSCLCCRVVGLEGLVSTTETMSLVSAKLKKNPTAAVISRRWIYTPRNQSVKLFAELLPRRAHNSSYVSLMYVAVPIVVAPAI